MHSNCRSKVSVAVWQQIDKRRHYAASTKHNKRLTTTWITLCMYIRHNDCTIIRLSSAQSVKSTLLYYVPSRSNQLSAGTGGSRGGGCDRPPSLNQICVQSLIGLKEATSFSVSISIFAPSFTRYTNITLKHTDNNHRLHCIDRHVAMQCSTTSAHSHHQHSAPSGSATASRSMLFRWRRRCPS